MWGFLVGGEEEVNLTNKYFCFDILIVLWQPTLYEKREPERITGLLALIQRSWLSNYLGPLSGIFQNEPDGVGLKKDRQSRTCVSKYWRSQNPLPL